MLIVPEFACENRMGKLFITQLKQKEETIMKDRVYDDIPGVDDNKTGAETETEGVANENGAGTGMRTETRTEILENVEEYGPIKPPLKDDPSLIPKIFLGIGGMIIISWVMLSEEQDLMIPFFWIAVIVYSVACLKNITPEEKGIKIILNTPDERHMYTGGLYWRWFFFQWFYLFPTEQVVIDIPEQEVITAEETITSDSGRKKVYSEAKVGINAVLYFFWPDTPEGLCEAYRKAPNPYSQEKLHRFFEPSLAAMIRGVAADFSWLKVRMNEQEYVDALQKEVKDNKKGPISKACITDFSIENKLVSLPPDLEKQITAEQEAIYAKEAGKHTAELNRIQKIEAGKGDAEAIRLELEAMAENPEMSRVRALQKMAEGDASTIFVEIPKELSGALSGNEIPQEFADIWNTLPKSQRTHLATKLAELGKKK